MLAKPHRPSTPSSPNLINGQDKGEGFMRLQSWFDYDPRALAVLLIGICSPGLGT
jgi:hypothetical protein